MTEQQLDAMKQAAIKTGKPAGYAPQLIPGTKLIRHRDQYQVVVTAVRNDQVSLTNAKGERFTTSLGSDILSEFKEVLDHQ